MNTTDFELKIECIATQDDALYPYQAFRSQEEIPLKFTKAREAAYGPSDSEMREALPTNARNTLDGIFACWISKDRHEKAEISETTKRCEACPKEATNLCTGYPHI